MNMDISYSTTCFGMETEPNDLLRWLEIIHSTGISKVELSRKHHNLGSRSEQIKALGVEVWSIHGTLSNFAISNNSTERDQAIATEIERMRDTAVFAPCPYVIHYLDRFNDPVCGQYFRKAIEQLIVANEEFGFILAIETAPYKPLENERYPDSNEIAAFVRSFNNDNVQMTIDINHSNIHEDILEVCHNCRGLIANIHVSDNHGEYEDHLVPGEGIIPIKAVMNELQKCDYTGPCNLEFHASELPDRNFILKINKVMAGLLA